MANEQMTKALGEQFRFTIKNTTGAALVVAILAAFFDTLLVTATEDAGEVTVKKQYTDASAIVGAGYACDYVVDDGVIIPGLVCTPSNSKFSFRAFREYIKQQGKVLVDMSVQANNVAAFNGVLEIVKCTAVKGAASDYLPLSEFYGVDQTSTSKINLRNVGMEMTFDSLMLMPIENGHEVTIAFKF